MTPPPIHYITAKTGVDHLHIVFEIHPTIETRGGPDQAELLKNLSVFERARLAIHTFHRLSEPSAANTGELDPAKVALQAMTDEVVHPTNEEISQVVMTLSDPDTTASVAARVLPRVFKYSRPEVARLDTMLSTLDEEIVNAAVRLRAYTVNKLLDETEHPDAKVRLKALELLGKVKDVGLFSEKVEITHRNKSDDEIEAEITRKLALLGSGEVVDADVVPDEPADTGENAENAGDLGIVDTSVDLDTVFGTPDANT